MENILQKYIDVKWNTCNSNAGLRERHIHEYRTGRTCDRGQGSV